MQIMGLWLCRCCLFLGLVGPAATLIIGLHLPSSRGQRARDINTLPASVSGNDDLGPTNLHRAMRNLSNQKSIDNDSIDRRKRSESNDEKDKLKIWQEIERITKSLQPSDSSLPSDVQQIEQEDKSLLGIEDILKVLEGRTARDGTLNVMIKEVAAVRYAKYEESADAMDQKPEDIAGITGLNNVEFDKTIDEVERKKQLKMETFSFLEMSENGDSLLCPQCDSPCDEDDMKDFGKCTFCRQKDLRDPSVHRIQYSDFSPYSNDAKSATRSSNTAVAAPDQRFLMDKQRKERQERLTSLPNVVNEIKIQPKPQPAVVLPQPKAVAPQKAVDNDKAVLSERRMEETLQTVLEPTQRNQMYNVKSVSEVRSDGQQSAQLREKAFKARVDFDEDPDSSTQEEYPGTGDMSERLEALERAVENLDNYTYRDIDNIKKDLSQVMSAYETLEERFEARLEEKLMQLRLEMLSVRSTDEASQTAVSSTRTDDSSQPAF